MNLEDAINTFSNAIATAEGYFVNGSRPQRNNNPGDLTMDLTGKAVGKDGPFVVYGSPDDGWEALHQQVRLILTDGSSIYNSAMTVMEIALHYTVTDQTAWANTVATELGISVDDPISTILTSVAVPAGIGLLVVIALYFLYRYH